MTDTPIPTRRLTAFARAVLHRAGLEQDKAATVATVLVEADLLGHTTHGLALLPPYLKAAEDGGMAGAGEPDVVASGGAVETWDGGKLPGPWLVTRAADAASVRARALGVAAVSIRRSHHIACLAAYLMPIVERGQLLMIASSDPAVASVAPFGGTQPLFTPNPLAAGWPTRDGAVLIDVSMSVTTNGMTGRLRAAGQQFEHPWLLDAQGRATRDPNALFSTPPGSILPLGGLEAGHKGFALGLLIEALTSALCGAGRADGPTGWGASVLVLVIDPAHFGGLDAFTRETGWLADQVAANVPADPARPPRMPGARALALRAEQLQKGVSLHPAIPPALAEISARYGIVI
jgi:L-lactate dehydrogenase